MTRLPRGAERSRAGGLAVALCLLVGSPLHAQPLNDKVQAETLFNEGRVLLKEGNLEQACSKLAASQRLDPAVGTLFSLAECFERRGLTASAWVTYREASSLAASRGDETRRTTAEQRSAALTPKLSKLVINLAPGAAVPGLVVSRDGSPVSTEALGSPLPVDPGTHTLEAKAPGRLLWSSSVEVGSDGAMVAATVPPLKEEPVAPTRASSQPTGRPPPGADDASSRSTGSTQRTVGLIAGGVGLVGIAIGTYLGLSARSKWGEVTDKCPDGRCPDSATEEALDPTRDEAARAGTGSTLCFVAGGAAFAAGAILFLTAPRTRPKSATLNLVPAASPGAGGVFLTGRF